MCGRYHIDPTPEFQSIIEEMNRSPLLDKWQRKQKVTREGEVRPTDVVPVIAPNKHGKRTVYPMKWGFQEKSLLINARVETAKEKPTFKEAWERHRCIIPASWYYEWEHRRGNDGKTHTGDKYMIQPQGSTMTWLCGLYRIEEGFPFFVILTREPGEGIRFIHDRMPVILPENQVDAWIHPDTMPEALLGDTLTKVVFEKVKPEQPAKRMTLFSGE